MLSIQGLSKYFGNTCAVEDVSFSVEKGKTMVLLGTSGCGKTTTLKMINRLVAPTSGQVLLDGKNIYDYKAEVLRRRIGYVIQHIGLFPHFSVRQNIGVVPQLLGWSKQKIDDRVAELMEILNLPVRDMWHRRPHELSGGQQQRVGIARALAADPPVILLDEPFGALDPITRGQLQHDFRSLELLRDKTMVMVTHDVLEAIVLADVVCLMDKGKIQQWGTPGALLFSPANDFVNTFFEAQRFRLELHAVRLGDIVPYARLQDNDGPAEAYLPTDMSLADALDQLENHAVFNPLIGTSPAPDHSDANYFYARDIFPAFYEVRRAWRQKIH